MEELDSFINIFINLSYSGNSLAKSRPDCELTIALKKEIDAIVKKLGKDDFPILKVIEEIENKISLHNQPKVAILRVLRRFVDISPHLLIQVKKEKMEEDGLKTLKIGNTSYYEGYFYTHQTLERYCNWEQPHLDYFQANIYEKYIIQCFDLFTRFFNQLDKLCLDFDIDIITIQEENGILVWIRDLHHLLGFGYEKKLKEIPDFPYQYPKIESSTDFIIETPQLSEKTVETDLSRKIKKHFGFFSRKCPRKHKEILNEEDFNKLINWTIEYFESNFEIPKISNPISVVNTNKTFVQLSFKYLFKELNKTSPYPETLFMFYKSAFIPYSMDKESNFIAVKNNDEVKRLMEIDY